MVYNGHRSCGHGIPPSAIYVSITCLVNTVIRMNEELFDVLGVGIFIPRQLVQTMWSVTDTNDLARS